MNKRRLSFMALYVYIVMMFLLLVSGVGFFLKGVVGAMNEADIVWFGYMIFGGMVISIGLTGLLYIPKVLDLLYLW